MIESVSLGVVFVLLIIVSKNRDKNIKDKGTCCVILMILLLFIANS
jgi:hypothetical protein